MNDETNTTSVNLESIDVNAKIAEIERKLAAESKPEKKKFRLPIKAYLMYFIVATILFTGVSLSKYAVSSGGSDSAGVATILVTDNADETFLNLSATPGEDTQFELNLINKRGALVSETKIRYTLEILNLTGNLPFTFTFYRKGDGGVLNEVGSTATATFEAGIDETHVYVVKIHLPVLPEAQSQEIDALRLVITSEQVD